MGLGHYNAIGQQNIRANGMELLNIQLRKEFCGDKKYDTLERYVMSEILSPIADYYNAIEIILQNSNLIEDLNLYYVAAYLCAEWMPERTLFLEKLNGMLEEVGDRDKAIIYYLNAHYYSRTEEAWRESEKYKWYLLKSVEHSGNCKFVNNRLDLARVSQAKEARQYLEDAHSRVIEVLTEEDLANISLDYRLSSQSFVDEFILGTHMTQQIYTYHFLKLIGEKE